MIFGAVHLSDGRGFDAPSDALDEGSKSGRDTSACNRIAKA